MSKVCFAVTFCFAVTVVGHRIEQTFFLTAPLSSSSNDYSRLVTWQMPLSRAVLLIMHDPSKLFGILSVYSISFQTQH